MSHSRRNALRLADYAKRGRFMHKSCSLEATPLPHPATPGLPPKPPLPSAPAPDERVERKRKQAELLQKGQALKLNPAKPSTALQKRFWKNVSVKETPEGFQVLLDARPVRTTSKNTLIIPRARPHLASAIALEWDLMVSAHQALKHHYIPLTSLAARALDIQVADTNSNDGIRQSITKSAMNYLNTDTLLCWAPERNPHDAQSTVDAQDDGSRSLRTLQMNTATPIINHLTTHVWPGVELKPILEEDSILPNPQPQATIETIRNWVSRLPAFELAALERGVLASKSLLVAARLVHDWSVGFSSLKSTRNDNERFTVEDAAEACTLEVSWQIGMWGEVEDTHDVDKEDVRRQLGSVVLLVHAE